MGKFSILPFIMLFLVITQLPARLVDDRNNPQQASQSTWADNSISIEVSEQLFERTQLIMQTSYESHPLRDCGEDIFSSIIPQMTAHWEQACLVQITPNASQKVFIDLGFGYDLRRYAYYDFFNQSMDYYWEPSFVIPVTFHLDSFFHHWDASTYLNIRGEMGLNFHARITTFVHQMFASDNHLSSMNLKFFAIHNYTSFNDDFFGHYSNYRMGFIFQSSSQ